MPIRVTWDNVPQLIAYITFDGYWTWPEYHQRAKEILSVLDHVTYPVDTITDFRTLYVPPDALTQLAPTREFLQHRNAGIDVVVTTSSFIEFMVTLFKQVYHFEGQSLLFAATVEEAYLLLAQ